jgi:hypothetical protein
MAAIKGIRKGLNGKFYVRRWKASKQISLGSYNTIEEACQVSLDFDNDPNSSYKRRQFFRVKKVDMDNYFVPNKVKERSIIRVQQRKETVNIPLTMNPSDLEKLLNDGYWLARKLNDVNRLEQERAGRFDYEDIEWCLGEAARIYNSYIKWLNKEVG